MYLDFYACEENYTNSFICVDISDFSSTGLFYYCPRIVADEQGYNTCQQRTTKDCRWQGFFESPITNTSCYIYC